MYEVDIYVDKSELGWTISECYYQNGTLGDTPCIGEYDSRREALIAARDQKRFHKTNDGYAKILINGDIL